MRTVSDCVVEEYEEIQSGALGASLPVSRLYVHLPVGAGLTHNYYYYFRRLDVWERPTTPSDQHLYSRLFTSGEQAPTVILEPDYLSFLNRLDRLDAGQLPPTLMLGVGYDGMTEALVALPGPFAHCADAGQKQGGMRYEPPLSRPS
jgi:hypothetical protein